MMLSPYHKGVFALRPSPDFTRLDAGTDFSEGNDEGSDVAVGVEG